MTKTGVLKIPILSYIYECLQLTCLALLAFSSIESYAFLTAIIILNVIYFFSRATAIFRIGCVAIILASTQTTIIIKQQPKIALVFSLSASIAWILREMPELSRRTMEWLVGLHKANICVECFADLNQQPIEEDIDWTTVSWGKDLCRKCKMKKVMQSCGYGKEDDFNQQAYTDKLHRD